MCLSRHQLAPALISEARNVFPVVYRCEQIKKQCTLWYTTKHGGLTWPCARKKVNCCLLVSRFYPSQSWRFSDYVGDLSQSRMQQAPAYHKQIVTPSGAAHALSVRLTTLGDGASPSIISHLITARECLLQVWEVREVSTNDSVSCFRVKVPSLLPC